MLSLLVMAGSVIAALIAGLYLSVSMAEDEAPVSAPGER